MVKRGYKGLKMITRNFKVLQGGTGGKKGIKRVSAGYRRLQGVTRGYKG